LYFVQLATLETLSPPRLAARNPGGIPQCLSTHRAGCPREEGIDYPLGPSLSDMPISGRIGGVQLIRQPLCSQEWPGSYEPDQWEALRATAADRKNWRTRGRNEMRVWKN
jgi:hypothetical protein